MTDTTRYLAISADALPRYYGYEGAAGHALMVPEGYQGDPLAAGTDIRRVCGGTIDVKRAQEKFTGDKLCKRCEVKITDKMIQVAEFAYADAEDAAPTVTEPQGIGALTLTEKGTKLSDARRAAPKPSTLKRDERPAKVEKCAVKGTHKVTPLVGTDTDGVNGECPACRTFAPLTSKGFIGSHNINNEPTPAGTGLKSSTVPPLVTDTAKKREAEAYTTEGRGENKTVTANVPDAPNAGAAIGQRDHGHMDGPAMLPRGIYANGARPDPKVVKEPKVGGKHGYLTYAEVGALSRTQQRKYWREVAKRRNAKR